MTTADIEDRAVARYMAQRVATAPYIHMALPMLSADVPPLTCRHCHATTFTLYGDVAPASLCLACYTDPAVYAPPTTLSYP